VPKEGQKLVRGAKLRDSKEVGKKHLERSIKERGPKSGEWGGRRLDERIAPRSRVADQVKEKGQWGKRPKGERGGREGSSQTGKWTGGTFSKAL